MHATLKKKMKLDIQTSQKEEEITLDQSMQ